MTAGRARRALELSAQPGQIFAAGQNDGGRDEAGGCSQGDAEKGDPHVTLPHDCRRERDWSLCHQRLDCSGVMADDGCEAAPYSRDCPGDFDLYRRSDRAVESLAGTAYSPRYSSLALFVAPTCAPSPKGNADFGWAVARRSCGRDQVRADTEAKMATGTVKMVSTRPRVMGSFSRRTAAETCSSISPRSSGPA